MPVGLINWLIQDPGNAAVAAEQGFVKKLAGSEPADKRRLMVDLYKRVIDGVADLGYPLSIHLEATYGQFRAGFRDLRRAAGLLVAEQRAGRVRLAGLPGRRRSVCAAAADQA